VVGQNTPKLRPNETTLQSVTGQPYDFALRRESDADTSRATLLGGRIFSYEKLHGVPQFELRRRQNEWLKLKQHAADDAAILSIARAKEIEQLKSDASRVCFNYKAPRNGQKAANWKDVLQYGETNTVTCNPGYEPTLGGVNTCDKGTSLFAECLPASCEDVDTPINGRKGDDWMDKLRSGESNLIQCNTGFAPTNDGRNICDKGKLKVRAECVAKSCENATAPVNGQIGHDWKVVLQSGESNSVHCDEGFTPTNDGLNICKNGTLTSFVACLPASCVDQDEPTNGRKGDGWNNTLSSGESNTVECHSGFEPSHDGLNRCIKGKLTTRSECKPASCPNVSLPPNGQKAPTTVWKDVLASGEFNTITCDAGYSATNNGLITCDKGKLTAPSAECKPASCSNVSLPPNGQKGPTTVWKDVLASGEFNTITCDAGYYATNNGRISCDKGKLTAPSAECKPASCSNVSPPPNGQKGPATTVWKDVLESGEFNTITCDAGYTATNNGLISCDKGKLTAPSAECKPASCSNVSLPPNAQKAQATAWKDVLASGEFNTITCDAGYIATNNGKITCDRGKLTTPSAECKPIACTNVRIPANAVPRHVEWKETLKPGETNYFNCNDGYTAAELGLITCDSNLNVSGVWGKPGTCKPYVDKWVRFPNTNASCFLGQNSEINLSNEINTLQGCKRACIDANGTNSRNFDCIGIEYGPGICYLKGFPGNYPNDRLAVQRCNAKNNGHRADAYMLQNPNLLAYRADMYKNLDVYKRGDYF
jgi:hypothetical protein